MSASPLKVELDKGGSLLRLCLSRPKANIIDAAMIAALRSALDEHLKGPHLRAVLLSAEGPHFSFGASVEEHMPETCAGMVRNLHSLMMQLVLSPVPILMAVRGQCLGGGLEVVSTGHRIFAAPGAMFGQPEIKLGVFAAPAACLLPERIGQFCAEDLLLTGRSIGTEEAHRMGLVNVVADDPEQAAVAYFDEYLAPLSASSLRFAVRAVRTGLVERLQEKVAILERMYLDEMMATHDAVEGLKAFVAKRPPVWEDR